MDDDDFTDEFGICVVPPRARRFQAADVMTAFLIVPRDIFQASANLFDRLSDITFEHSNWKTEQRKFASEAGLAIEKITEGTDG